MEIALKIVSLLSYSFIILAGQMIGIPFIFWLIFTSFDFGNAEQIFAFVGLVGLILNFTKYIKSRGFKVLSFLLMLTPIIKRLTETPVEKFNYLAFIIPLSIFIITYIVLITKKTSIRK